MDDMDDFECDDFDKTLKVIVVGNGNVGKTSMTTRYAKGRYTGNYKKTIGVDFMEKRLELRDLGETVNLMIWDTAGQEEFGALTSRYYKGAGAVIYVFSTTDRDSFEDLPKWQRKVEEECGRISQVLVQNKIDLVDDAAMSRSEVEDMADYMRIRLFRSCVQDNVNVKEVFEHLCRQYLRNSKNGGGDDALHAVADISTLSEAAASAALKGSQPSPSYERRSRGTREISELSDSDSSPSPTTSLRDREREKTRGSDRGWGRDGRDGDRDRERDRDRDRDRDRGRESGRFQRPDSDERPRKALGDDFDDEDEPPAPRRSPPRRDERQRGWDRDEEDSRDQAQSKSRDRERDREKSRPSDRDRDRGRDRDYDRDCDRDRGERPQDREKGRDRDRDRDRDREGARDRERDRPRDQDRGQERFRDRGAEKERSRTRDKEKGRDRDRELGRELEDELDLEREKPKPKERSRDRARENDEESMDREPKMKERERENDDRTRSSRSKDSRRERPKDVDKAERSPAESPQKEASIRETELGSATSTATQEATAGRDSRQNSRSMRESDQATAKDKKISSRPHSEKVSEAEKKPMDKASLRAQLREGNDSDSESEHGGGGSPDRASGVAGKTSTALSESNRIQPSKRRTNGKKKNALLHKMSQLLS